MENLKKQDIFNWIEQSLEDKQFVQKEIIINGTNKKMEKYSGDIIFATVKGVDKNGRIEEVDLVIKLSNQNEELRKNVPMLYECYRREILVYEKIIPAFRKLQAEKSIDSFDAIPKCFKTFSAASSEVLLLENVTKQGYMMHNMEKPMNIQHVQLVLNNYAKLHALSFALQDQRPEEYNIITSNYHRHNIQMLDQLSELFKITQSKVIYNLNVSMRKDLAKQFKEAVGIGIENRLLDILKDDVEYSVITHGGCHNNNFMFQYEGNDNENPTRMILLDWQLSIQHSPVIDLSGFLYSVGGEHIYKIEDLLEYYHSTLTSYLADLGTDISTVFPFTALLDDWRKYSFYGFAFLITFLGMFFFENKRGPVVDNIDIIFNKEQLENGDEYKRRLVMAVDQYCNHAL